MTVNIELHYDELARSHWARVSGPRPAIRTKAVGQDLAQEAEALDDVVVLMCGAFIVLTEVFGQRPALLDTKKVQSYIKQRLLSFDPDAPLRWILERTLSYLDTTKKPNSEQRKGRPLSDSEWAMFLRGELSEIEAADFVVQVGRSSEWPLLVASVQAGARYEQRSEPLRWAAAAHTPVMFDPNDANHRVSFSTSIGTIECAYFEKENALALYFQQKAGWQVRSNTVTGADVRDHYWSGKAAKGDWSLEIVVDEVPVCFIDPKELRRTRS